MHPADNPLVSHPYKAGPLKLFWLKTRRASRPLIDSALSLLPIVLVIAFFQLVVLQQPIPRLGEILRGAVLVLVGLALFVKGLQMALFPIGEEMARNFVRKSNLWWLLIFAFTLGFGTTVAEPALIAIVEEAARIAAAGQVIGSTVDEQEAYATGLRLTVALAVAFALALGVFRILNGWSLQYLIIVTTTGHPCLRR